MLYEYYTDAVSKEDFFNKLPLRADRILLMKQMLDCYSVSLAAQRNTSFAVFHDALQAQAV